MILPPQTDIHPLLVESTCPVCRVGGISACLGGDPDEASECLLQKKIVNFRLGIMYFFRPGKGRGL